MADYWAAPVLTVQRVTSMCCRPAAIISLRSDSIRVVQVGRAVTTLPTSGLAVIFW